MVVVEVEVGAAATEAVGAAAERAGRSEGRGQLGEASRATLANRLGSALSTPCGASGRRTRLPC